MQRLTYYNFKISSYIRISILGIDTCPYRYFSRMSFLVGIRILVLDKSWTNVFNSRKKWVKMIWSKWGLFALIWLAKGSNIVSVDSESVVDHSSSRWSPLSPPILGIVPNLYSEITLSNAWEPWILPYFLCPQWNYLWTWNGENQKENTSQTIILLPTLTGTIK